MAGITFTDPQNTITFASELVTIAQLIVDAGSASETRTIGDPSYPGANGGVTWSATDPLSGTDPGGKARYWARYPDGSGGFWVRDDWDALTVAAGAANAISLDWITIDEDEDISTVFGELITQYIDGSEGNVLSIKGPEDVSSFKIGDLDAVGDGSATGFYWYKPTANKCVVNPKALPLGTEDLIAKTWTDQGSGQWDTTVGETVLGLRLGTLEIASGTQAGATAGPFLSVGDNKANAVDCVAGGDWHFAGSTLTVYSNAGDPSDEFAAGMWYVTSVAVMDKIIHFEDVHKIRIEGGTSYLDSEFGLEFVGNAGRGQTSSASGGPEPFSFDYTGTFTKAGSLCEFLCGTSELNGKVQWNGDSVRRLEKLTLGGIHGNTRFDPGPSGVITSWLHWHEGDSSGDAFELISWFGETGDGWAQRVSESGADSDVSPGNRAAGRSWEYAHIRNQVNFEKVTGTVTGPFGIPFIGQKGSVQIGNSLADPFTWVLRDMSFTIHPDLDVYTPNTRPVFFDGRDSTAIHYGKCDTFNVRRGDTAFMHIINEGIVDRSTKAHLVVDLRDDTGTPANNKLGVTANPADYDLGYRSPLTTFEVTIPEGPAGIAGMDLKITGANGEVGSGNIDFGEIDQRFPYNWSGYWTIHGDETEDCFATLFEVPPHSTVDNFNFAGIDYTPALGRNGGFGIVIGSAPNYIKPTDITIGSDVTFSGNSKMKTTGRTTQQRGVGPHDIKLASGLTVTGTARTWFEVHPHKSGWYNEGHPITIKADGTTNWDSGMIIDNPDSTANDNIYFSDDNGTTWYEVPWEKGGSNTTKSAPPDLVGLNYAWRTFSGTSVNLYMPQFFRDGNHCTVVLWFDGDPGTITPASGFSSISGVSANLSDNSLYVRAYEGTFATGTDLWNEVSDAITESFSWVNSVAGYGYSTEHTGQNATPIGNASSTAHNTAGTSHTAPTISVSTDSMIMAFIGFASNSAYVSALGGSLSPWMHRTFYNETGPKMGRNGADAFSFDTDNVGVGHCAAELYSGASGSKAGCAFTLDTSLKAITTSIEIKT